MKRHRLLDLFLRHQLYLQQVEHGFFLKYITTLGYIYSRVAAVLAHSRVTSLDQLSQQQLQRMISDLQKFQHNQYKTYFDKTQSAFFDLVKADLLVSEAMLGDSGLSKHGDKSIFDLSSPVHLYEEIIQEPIPANGLLLEDQMRDFLSKAAIAVSATIQKGYANNWTVEQTLNQLEGSSSEGNRDGILNKLSIQMNALLATGIQHLSLNVQSAVASEFYSEYVWVAVLDNKTTLICRSRNGVIYVYGKGPLPPAHYNCRSKAVPHNGEAFNIPQSYYDWIKEQPENFQNDVLGAAQAAELRAGNLTAVDFTAIRTTKALTISEFKDKIKIILSN